MGKRRLLNDQLRLTETRLEIPRFCMATPEKAIDHLHCAFIVGYHNDLRLVFHYSLLMEF